MKNVDILKSLKALLYVSLEVEPGPCPRAAVWFLGYSSLVFASLPFLDQQLFESALWNSGKFMEARVCFLQENRGQKGFCAQEPHGVLLGFSLRKIIFILIVQRRKKSEFTQCPTTAVHQGQDTRVSLSGPKIYGAFTYSCLLTNILFL